MLYLAAKRIHFKIPYIKRGKKDRDEDMLKVAKIIEDLKCDPSDYINFNIKALAPIRVFPTPAHLASDKAKARYQVHMLRMGISNTEWYYIDHYSFTVKKSYQSYDLKTIEGKGIDPDEQYVLFLANHPETDIHDSLDKIFYVEAKYRYLMKTITEPLQALIEKADKEVMK